MSTPSSQATPRKGQVKTKLSPLGVWASRGALSDRRRRLTGPLRLTIISPTEMRGGVLRSACVKAGAAAVLCLAVAGGAYGSGVAATFPLAQRVLKAGQFAGMKPSKPPTVINSASGWAQGNTTMAAQLRHWGFVAGVAENMLTPGNQSRFGLSIVMKFASAASAKAELASDSTSNGPWRYFKVPGIPGARGFEALAPAGTGGTSGRNVGFTDGPYFYLVGAGWSGDKNAVSRSAVIAGGLLIYQRVNVG